MWRIWLIVYYVSLTLILWFRKRSSVDKQVRQRLLPSSLISKRSRRHHNHRDATLYRSCLSGDDCFSEQVCFHERCLPKLREGDDCDPRTGDWTLVDRKGDNFVACTCRYPELFAQRRVGGNCDVETACRPNGRIGGFPDDVHCVCSEGFKYVRKTAEPMGTTPRHACVPAPVSERNASGRCDITSQVDLRGPFNENVSRTHSTVARCVRRPCTFDVLTGRPLRHTRYDIRWGCVCDPRRGNVGVRMDHPDYASVPGYNGCVNLFGGDEPAHDLKNVALYTYFHLFDRQPIAFVQFTGLDTEKIAHPFPRSPNLQIGEIWPHNYAQHVFREGKYSVRTRECEKNYRVSPMNRRLILDTRSICRENVIKYNHWKICHSIPIQALEKHVTIERNLYKLYYEFPACKVDEREAAPYGGWFVSNPFHVTYHHPEAANMEMSNGLVLTPDTTTSQNRQHKNGWHVDMTPSVTDYISGARFDLVPNYNHHVKLLHIPGDT